jgi:hypothetical protein
MTLSYLEIVESALIDIVTDVAKTASLRINESVVRSFESADDLLGILGEGFPTPLIVMTPQGTGIPIEVAPGRVASQKVDMRFVGSIAVIDASVADFEKRRKPMYRMFHQFLRGIQDVRLNKEPFGVNVILKDLVVTSTSTIDVKEFYATVFAYRYDLMLPTKAVI